MRKISVVTFNLDDDDGQEVCANSEASMVIEVAHACEDVVLHM